MQRRGFLRGLLAMPFVIRTPNLLMPIRRLLLPDPPSPFGPNLSEIVQTTLRHRAGPLVESLNRNNAILARLMEREKLQPFTGGRTIISGHEWRDVYRLN